MYIVERAAKLAVYGAMLEMRTLSIVKYGSDLRYRVSKIMVVNTILRDDLDLVVVEWISYDVLKWL